MERQTSSTMDFVSNTGITVIDGTRYEGGGGLIRDTLSYATILNKPVRIESIRANRPGTGGLRLEHTVAIDTVSKLAASIVDGNTPASREITFRPHAAPEVHSFRSSFPLQQSLHSMEVTVEGAAAILMVAVLPYVLFSTLGPAATKSFSAREALGDSGIEFTIRAGTLCVKAPSFVYVHQVLLPTFRAIGISEENLQLRDDYEQGWHTDFARVPGRMTMWARPLARPLPAFQLERRGAVVRLRAMIHGPVDILNAFHATVRQEIQGALTLGPGCSPSSSVEVLSEAFASTAPGQYHLLLVAETEGPRAFLGYEQVYPQKEGFPHGLESNTAELHRHLTRVCLRGLYDELAHGNAVDEHTEALLIPYQVLAHGFSSTTAERNKQLVQENEELAVPFSMTIPFLG
ncbi:RNA 3'-terminal phosphate cyclase/enolpyruvate transferase [Aspergillus pseudodeflectus]|uniref:RNA 3'-terminal phosphate cyclase/enolpyruvate transferase n=1 Tax=Aspergillus pseudodeflectus TaxID=176178 RepID=A0ABR4JR51_9EURO